MAQQDEEPKSIVTLQADIKGIKSGVAEFNKVKQELIGTAHVMKIKGHDYIKKSGWRMVALGFNISDRIVARETKEIVGQGAGEYVITYTVEAKAPNGRTVEAIGACSTLEKTNSGARKFHDAETQAHTRAKNRAIADLVGLGEVTAEEMVSSESEAEGLNSNKTECDCEQGKRQWVLGKCNRCGLPVPKGNK